MQQGLIDAIESLLKDQIQLASEINNLANRQYLVIVANGEYSADEADQILTLTTRLEMLEKERHAMLEGSSVGMDELLPLSQSLRDSLESWRDAIAAMRDSIKKNVAILDMRILHTRTMFDAVRQATGASGDPVEYSSKGKVKRGSGGGLLGAG